MNFLKFNPKQSSYFTPIIKVVIAALVCVFSFYFNPALLIEDPFIYSVVNAFTRVSATIVAMLCVYSVFISLAEMIAVSENKSALTLRRKDIHSIQSKTFDTEHILNQVKDNDIIEIIGLLQERLTNFGTSSDYNNQKGEFLEKKFYIDDAQYSDYELFRADFIRLSGEEATIKIVSIDGVVAQKLKK